MMPILGSARPRLPHSARRIGTTRVSFESDYIAGAHPEVLRRLTETNLEPLPGYGEDPYCARAKEKIARACE